MPLNPSAAKTELGNLFKSPPGDEATAAAGWASAIQTLCAGIVPASTTVAAAAATLQGALAGFNAPDATAGKTDAAMTAFAATVGGGMAGYTPTPPPAPLGISFSNTSDAQAAADAFIDAVDTWLKTGSSTLIAPPNTVVPWS